MDPRLRKLHKVITAYGKALVAFSGGADSSLLLKVCVDVLGAGKVLAVTAASETYTSEELAHAEKFAKKLGGQGVVEAMTMNYAQVLAGLGSSYLQQQNFRKAKELLKQSLEQAKKTSETPERRQLVKQVEEGLSRLKRW